MRSRDGLLVDSPPAPPGPLFQHDRCRRDKKQATPPRWLFAAFTMESISRRVISPCLCEISSHTSTWTRLQMEGTDHNDTRSRRLGFGGYLGEFTSLSTPSLYDSWRVSMEGSSTVDSSESDINLGSLRRDRSRESRAPICQGDRSREGGVGPGFCRHGSSRVPPSRDCLPRFPTLSFSFKRQFRCGPWTPKNSVLVR